ncbi:MAG: hypothetical protein IPM16_10535 [Chloroflexi bacterium]|nr:hypothetical protein [Chloroflexota bacterium]
MALNRQLPSSVAYGSWDWDVQARQHVAILCACARDSILNSIAPRIVDLPIGSTMTRDQTADWIDSLEPNRFSETTLMSIAKNINSSWTQAGYLAGKVRKTRIYSSPTVGSVVYGLFLNYIDGRRGLQLVQEGYVKLLDCTPQDAIEKARQAAQRGWIVLKHVEGALEVGFPRFLSSQEMSQLNEQN